MEALGKFVRLINPLGILVSLLVFPLSASALTQILPNAAVEADEQTILEIIRTFDEADEAIRSRNLDVLMSLYASSYRYHGLGKDEVRKIWADLFQHYEYIDNLHTFSAIKLVGEAEKRRIEITCSGALWANSKGDKARKPIDSWHEEVHYLVKEKDAWRILGNAGGEASQPTQFGTAPHPLF